jgi:hypothetical protein
MAEVSVTVAQFSNGKLHVDPAHVRATNGPVYPLLTVPTELRFRKLDIQREIPKFAVLSVQAGLFISPGTSKIADSVAIFDPLEVLGGYEASQTYPIEFPLDPYRIRLLEASRRGNMSFQIKFQFLIAHYETILIQKGGRQAEQHLVSGYERLQQQTELNVEIPQSLWVSKVLPALGVGEYFLIEIPKGNKTVPAAWDYLEKAETAFRHWNSKEVYGNCRELGVLLDQAIKAKFGVNDFSYSIRWRRAYSGFADMASWSLHLEDLKKSPKYTPDSVQTSKADAEHLLLRTKELLKYAEEILDT